MATTTSFVTKSSTRVQWMWKLNGDLLSESEQVQWKSYSDVENMIIEEAFQLLQDHVILDDCIVDLKNKIQIFNNNEETQHPVKRMICSTNDSRIRAERFACTPASSKPSFGGLYGWISPFIREAVKYLHITNEELPSKNEIVIPMVVDKAADGIIEEGKKIGKTREAEHMAKILREKKHARLKEVWECCTSLYTLESFLYKEINNTMRLIGDKGDEQNWRAKVPTWGPFCLLLWDNPSGYKIDKRGLILYRGANLTDKQISIYKEDCSNECKPVHSFQAFTSCSRSRTVAEFIWQCLVYHES